MTRPYTIIGIDPGISGAIALVEVDGPFLTLVDLWDVPTYKHTANRKRIMEPNLGEIFQNLEDEWVRQAYIERVHAMPKQGTASTFAFGMAVGLLRGAAATAGIPVRDMTPTQWKRAMGLRGDKDAARGMAVNLFPSRASDFERKKDIDRAEAALIAVAGHKMNGEFT